MPHSGFLPTAVAEQFLATGWVCSTVGTVLFSRTFSIDGTPFGPMELSTGKPQL
jgi:hypothetical protein